MVRGGKVQQRGKNVLILVILTYSKVNLSPTINSLRKVDLLHSSHLYDLIASEHATIRESISDVVLTLRLFEYAQVHSLQQDPP